MRGRGGRGQPLGLRSSGPWGLQQTELEPANKTACVTPREANSESIPQSVYGANLEEKKK